MGREAVDREERERRKGRWRGKGGKRKGNVNRKKLREVKSEQRSSGRESEYGKSGEEVDREEIEGGKVNRKKVRGRVNRVS